MQKKYTKTGSFLIVIIIYLLAVITAYFVYRLFKPYGILAGIFFADIAATIIVWLFGIILKNSSVYDPYWSIAPMIIIPIWFIIRGTPLNIPDIVIFTAVLFWGIRLTYNWAAGWGGLHQIDWRYVMLKEKNPKLWQITNFGGINLMPTIIVYLALIPAYYSIFTSSTHNVFLYIGFIICILSALLQLIADYQMKKFRKNKSSNHIDTGLWKYSRHPNYFGEVSFWWGIFIMHMGLSSGLLITIIGAVLMTCLFVFISIPMMEKYVADKRPDYKSYKSQVSMLIPWFRK